MDEEIEEERLQTLPKVTQRRQDCAKNEAGQTVAGAPALNPMQGTKCALMLLGSLATPGKGTNRLTGEHHVLLKFYMCAVPLQGDEDSET